MLSTRVPPTGKQFSPTCSRESRSVRISLTSEASAAGVKETLALISGPARSKSVFGTFLLTIGFSEETDELERLGRALISSAELRRLDRVRRLGEVGPRFFVPRLLLVLNNNFSLHSAEKRTLSTTGSWMVKKTVLDGLVKPKLMNMLRLTTSSRVELPSSRHAHYISRVGLQVRYGCVRLSNQVWENILVQRSPKECPVVAFNERLQLDPRFILHLIAHLHCIAHAFPAYVYCPGAAFTY